MSLAGSCVVPHLTLLRRCGFCNLPSPLPLPKHLPAGLQPSVLSRRLHGAYCMFALAVTSFYVLQQAIYAYQERSDMVKLARVLFVMLCHVTCVAKQIVFHVDAARIDQIIAGLDDPLYNPTSQSQRTLLASTADSAARLLRCYSGCAVATCVLWVVLPVVYRLRGFHIEFPFWTLGDYNKPLVFVVVLTHSFYATNLVAVGNTTMDAFIATILYQCKTQLRLLRMNFENLAERAKLISRGQSKASFDAVLVKLFLESIHHFEKVSNTVELLQSVFGMAILVQFGVGGWTLCMAAYKIVSVNVLSFEFASTTLFIVCILVELFLYCYYGNEVAVESDRMVESIYAMEWLAAPVQFKKSLVLVMERAKRPLRPAAGLIIPLSLDTFITILKSSYSFYAVLRQTK